MNSKMWKNRVVLVTGYEGFLGSNLTKELISFGARVVGIDIKTGRKDTVLTREEIKRMNVIKGDVADHALVKGAVKRHKPSVIFHLAAESLVNECNRKPVRGFETNIEGTWNVLESARLNKCMKAVVVASSDKAYGSQKILPYTEQTPLQGKHPYDVSKSCADLISLAYHNTYGLPVSVTRCGNIYGAGDFNFSRIIPDAIRCAVKGRTLVIRSDGKFVRDYVYVDDIVSGYVLIAERMLKRKVFGETFNLSDENPISVLGLLKKMYKLMRRKPDYVILNKAKYEIKEQYLDSKKARRLLNWKPRFSLSEGLSRTIEWYRQIIN
ncbi:MAG: GDP-mannose 4,6-dehydratase [Endomicrobiales bacterium]|nr:GDP-mannose 4,6-dehydratase [Endomicrobiales bacterium]